MCDCDSNITNDANFENLYSVSNIGSGIGLYAGNTVVPPLTTFRLKSLIAGTNISLSSDSSSVTITNDITPTDSVTNLGTGAPVLVDVLAGSIRARTLVGLNGMAVNASGNEVNLSDEQIQSLSSVLTYNYGQTLPNIDLTQAYNSPSGLASNTVPDPELVSGSLTNVGPTQIDYIPGPRWTNATFIPFETVANNGTTNASWVKVQPNTSISNDYVNDYILGLSNSGSVFQINLNTFTENPMVKYNGDPLTFGPTPEYIAMDVEDAVLFFSAGDEIYTYDFTLDMTTFLFNVTSLAGWNASIRYIYYARSTLYILDKDFKFWLISIKPFDRLLSSVISYGTACYYRYEYPGDMFTFSINEETGFPLITYDNGGTRISSGSSIGASTTGTEFQSNTLENNSSRYLTIAPASGRVYAYSPDNVKFYRFDYGTSIEQGVSGLFGTANTYVSLTRTPYGVLA